MVIRTESSLALYCPHCGKLHMHDFFRFSLCREVRRELVCSCGHVQAAVNSVNRRQYLFDIPCVICGTNHKIFVDARRFWRAEADKLYCMEGNVELGLFGRRQAIEETFSNNKHEFERLLAEDHDSDTIDNLHVMFEIFNRIHDLAEQERIICSCGRPVIDAEMLPDTIEIACRQCSGHRSIPASTEAHLEEVKSWRIIQLTSQRRSHHKQ